MTTEPRTDTERLDLLLRHAHLCTTEDGEHLGLYLGDAENECAALTVAEATDEQDGSFTTGDVPFLTEGQRAELNGAVGTTDGKWANDPAVIRAAIDFACHTTTTRNKR